MLKLTITALALVFFSLPADAQKARSCGEYCAKRCSVSGGGGSARANCEARCNTNCTMQQGKKK